MDEFTRDQIMQMHEVDLAVRLPMIEAIRGSGGIISFLQRDEMQPLIADANRADAEMSVQAMEILERVGWPTESMVGKDAAQAWTHLIAQRVSVEALDVSLPHLRSAAARNEISAVMVAEIEDRADVVHGRQQRYGTQWTQSPDRGYEPYPVDDLALVEERRACLGLLPLAEHKRRMEEMYGAP